MKIELRWINDDWVELLVDGEMVAEGHSLGTEDVIRKVAPDADFAAIQVYRCIYCETSMPDSGDQTYQCGNCL